MSHTRTTTVLSHCVYLCSTVEGSIDLDGLLVLLRTHETNLDKEILTRVRPLRTLKCSSGFYPPKLS